MSSDVRTILAAVAAGVAAVVVLILLLPNKPGLGASQPPPAVYLDLSAFGEGRVGLGSTRDEILAIPGASRNDVMRDEVGYAASGLVTYFHFAFDAHARANYVSITLRELSPEELQGVIQQARRLVLAVDPGTPLQLQERDRVELTGTAFDATVSYGPSRSSTGMYAAVIRIQHTGPKTGSR